MYNIGRVISNQYYPRIQVVGLAGGTSFVPLQGRQKINICYFLIPTRPRVLLNDTDPDPRYVNSSFSKVKTIT